MIIQVESYGKINLTLDVGEVLPNGMHPVDMIMQHISLKDIVEVEVLEGEEDFPKITLTCTNPRVPVDETNLAYKAALLMIEECKLKGIKEIKIHIEKNIPMAAGLAGGSGNGAAVLHGMNALLNLDLGTKDLCRLGAKLGSDVPFCVMGQAKGNKNLPEKIQKEGFFCARARGTGTELRPCRPLDSFVLLGKPDIDVSTGEVYQGIDGFFIARRPNNNEAVQALESGDLDTLRKNMINVLENYTLEVKSKVAFLKDDMMNLCQGAEKVLMSGSGPTVFAIFIEEGAALKSKEALIKKLDSNYVVELCHTLI